MTLPALALIQATTGTSDAWAVLAAALGASALTSLGAGYLDRRRAKREEKRARLETLQQSCERFVGAALRLAQRSGALFQTMHVRSGFTESLDIVLHHRKPVDPLELTDWIIQDIGPMLEAQSIIWFLGSDQLIKEASDALVAAGEVVGASTHLSEEQRIKPIRSWRDLSEIKRRLTPLKIDPESESARNMAVINLGRSLRRFAATMRTELGTADPGALLRRFPAPVEDDGD